MLKNYFIKINIDVTVNGDVKKWFDGEKFIGPVRAKSGSSASRLAQYTTVFYDADALRFHNEKDAIDFLENLNPNNVRDVVFLNEQGFEKVEPEFVVHPVIYKYANLHMYTDIQPYEIVRIASVKTMYVRPMIAMKGEWKKKVAPGGFCGHVVNQNEQKWSVVSDSTADAIAIRKQKDGSWKSKNGRHILSCNPRKFYDYNF